MDCKSVIILISVQRLDISNPFKSKLKAFTIFKIPLHFYSKIIETKINIIRKIQKVFNYIHTFILHKIYLEKFKKFKHYAKMFFFLKI